MKSAPTVVGIEKDCPGQCFESSTEKLQKSPHSGQHENCQSLKNFENKYMAKLRSLHGSFELCADKIQKDFQKFIDRVTQLQNNLLEGLFSRFCQSVQNKGQKDQKFEKIVSSLVNERNAEQKKLTCGDMWYFQNKFNRLKSEEQIEVVQEKIRRQFFEGVGKIFNQIDFKINPFLFSTDVSDILKDNSFENQKNKNISLIALSKQLESPKKTKTISHKNKDQSEEEGDKEDSQSQSDSDESDNSESEGEIGSFGESEGEKKKEQKEKINPRKGKNRIYQNIKKEANSKKYKKRKQERQYTKKSQDQSSELQKIRRKPRFKLKQIKDLDNERYKKQGKVFSIKIKVLKIIGYQVIKDKMKHKTYYWKIKFFAGDQTGLAICLADVGPSVREGETIYGNQCQIMNYFSRSYQIRMKEVYEVEDSEEIKKTSNRFSLSRIHDPHELEYSVCKHDKKWRTVRGIAFSQEFKKVIQANSIKGLYFFVRVTKIKSSKLNNQGNKIVKAIVSDHTGSINAHILSKKGGKYEAEEIKEGDILFLKEVTVKMKMVDDRPQFHLTNNTSSYRDRPEKFGQNYRGWTFKHLDKEMVEQIYEKLYK